MKKLGLGFLLALMCLEGWATQKPSGISQNRIIAVAVSSYRRGCDEMSNVKFDISDPEELNEVAKSFLEEPQNFWSSKLVPSGYVFFKGDNGEVLSGLIVGDTWFSFPEMRTCQELGPMVGEKPTRLLKKRRIY